MSENDFEVISRFRDDTDLRYYFEGEQTQGHGRHRKYGRKVAPKNRR